MDDFAYSTGFLDRASSRQSDLDWIAALSDAPETRLVPIWRDHCLVSGNPPAPVTSLDGDRYEREDEPGTLLFLGLDGEIGFFAADLSSLTEERAIEIAGAERIGDLRAFAGTMSAAEAAILAYARGLIYWNRHQGFCGTRGAPTLSRQAGHVRACGNDSCGLSHFPHIAPAVITLVETVGPPQRCLLGRHSGAAQDSYALIAGFVEIGESLEDAAAKYLEARCVTRAELAERAASGVPLGRVDSIDRVLLQSWLNHESCLPA